MTENWDFAAVSSAVPPTTANIKQSHSNAKTIKLTENRPNAVKRVTEEDGNWCDHIHEQYAMSPRQKRIWHVRNVPHIIPSLFHLWLKTNLLHKYFTSQTLFLTLDSMYGLWFRPDTLCWLLFTFHVRPSRSKMYIGHSHLCVCLCVCLSLAAFPHYCTDPDITWRNGRDAL